MPDQMTVLVTRSCTQHPDDAVPDRPEPAGPYMRSAARAARAHRGTYFMYFGPALSS